MLPIVIYEPFDSADYIFEVKWGGVRAIGQVEGPTVRLHGRNLRELTPLYPEVETLSECLGGRQAVVDGEILAWGAERLPAFELLRPRLLRPDDEVKPPKRSPILYQVFDLLALDGEWLMDRPLFQRRNLLHRALQPNRIVQVADFIAEEGVALYHAVAAHGLEGIVAKSKFSTYSPGEQSPAWQEIRASQTGEFVIGGYSFGGGLRNDPIASLLLGAFHNDRLEFVGQVSVGCSDREAQLLLDLLIPLHVQDCPFSTPPDVPRFLYWCRPELVGHVRFAEWTAEGQLRFPFFVAPRPDVPAEECLRRP
jgi:bifunctional non-homologous end joining protein LigD